MQNILKLKIAFLSEMGFEGKVPDDHANMRTEFAWMNSLNADHFNIRNISRVINYDHVFIIFPKGKLFLSAEGSKISNEKNPVSDLLQSDFLSQLKDKNRKIHFIQEGPHWWYNDYEIPDQIGFYNLISQCDTIFAHNGSDTKYYSGIFPSKPIHILSSLMIDSLVEHIKRPDQPQNVIIGGNFSRWYGGFESYIIAGEFLSPIWAQTSHSKREYEDQIENLNHLPRLDWINWMTALSEFKYAVHMMHTVAAGTFSLNCAYFGIPCIGNEKVDTQLMCHPELSVDIDDIHTARKLALRLKNDQDFYKKCSEIAKSNYKLFYHKDNWLNNMSKILYS